MSRIKDALVDCTVCYEFGPDPDCRNCMGTGMQWVKFQPCEWCKGQKPGAGWHDCPEALRGKERLDAALAALHELMARPQSQALTSYQMAVRAKRLTDMATAAGLAGRPVNPEYQ